MPSTKFPEDVPCVQVHRTYSYEEPIAIRHTNAYSGYVLCDVSFSDHEPGVTTKLARMIRKEFKTADQARQYARENPGKYVMFSLEHIRELLPPETVRVSILEPWVVVWTPDMDTHTVPL